MSGQWSPHFKNSLFWYVLFPVGVALGIFLLYLGGVIILHAQAHPPHKVTCTGIGTPGGVHITYMGGLQHSWVEALTIRVDGEEVLQVPRPQVGDSWTFQAPPLVLVECIALDAATGINWTIYKKVI